MQRLAEDSQPITDINVTPLVDIILVVLIIFMATAPLISRRAVNVDIPAASLQERAELEVLNIVLDENHALQLGSKPISRAELARELTAWGRTSPGVRVMLSADKRIPYGEIIELLDLVRSAGLRKVSLEVRPR